MKLKYFLFAALLSPAFSYAQSPATLVGLAHSVYSDSLFVSVDTAWLSYSNGRGSDVKTVAPFYPSLLATPTGNAGMYNYDVWGMADYDSAHAMINMAQHTKMYDSTNGNRLLSDTYSVPDSSASWIGVSRVMYEYDSTTGAMTAEFSQDMVGANWINSARHEYTYDPANNITSITTLGWTGTNWVNGSKNIYYYNFLNKVTSSLVQTWNGVSWMNSEHYIYYSHDNNVTVDSTYYQQMSAPNWVTITRDIYRNNANHDAIVHWHYDGANLTWGDSTFYDGMHNMTSQNHKVWDTAANALVNVKQYSWAYNAYNQPVSMVSATWDPSGLWIFNNSDMMTAYYYSFDSTTRVANVTSISNMQLYPVPAQNTVNLEMTWSTQAPFTVAILDMQGRIIRQWNESATANYSKSIPVTDLASGTYFITIKNSTTSTARQFSVVH